MHRLLVPALIVAALAATSARSQETLEWDFNKNKTFYVEVFSTSKQTLNTTGRELKQDLEQTTVFSVKVESVAPGAVVLEEKLEWLAVKTSGTAGVPDERYNAALKDIKFKVTLDKNGTVTKFEGYDDLMKKVAGDDAAQKAARAVLSEESLKQAAAEIFSFLPDKPVKAGDSWSRESEKPLGPIGSLKLARKYTYEGQESEGNKLYHRVAFDGTGTFAPPLKVAADAFQFKVTKGDVKVENFKGLATFDKDNGRLLKLEWTMRLNGSVTIALDESKRELDTKALQEMTVKMKILTEKPEKPMGPGPGM